MRGCVVYHGRENDILNQRVSSGRRGDCCSLRMATAWLVGLQLMVCVTLKSRGRAARVIHTTYCTFVIIRGTDVHQPADTLLGSLHECGPAAATEQEIIACTHVVPADKFILYFFFFSSRRRHTRLTVTGVQTCALPISSSAMPTISYSRPHGCRNWIARSPNRDASRTSKPRLVSRLRQNPSADTGTDRLSARRSEERRVGKECRSRWSPYH